MKKILSVLLVMAMMFSFCSVVANADTVGTTEIESNDTANTATLIEGSVMTGVLSAKTDVDWYKFSADADYFEVDFGVSSASLGTDTSDVWDLAIYDADMNELISYSGAASVDGYRFAVSGTVYIKVSAYNTYYWTEGVYYDVTVSKTTDAHWEDEYNDASNKAQAINANEKYTANLHLANDVDWYKFTSLDYFVIDFGVNTALATDAVDGGWDVTVYDSSLQEIDTFSDVDDITSAPYAFTGDIYVKVENYSTVYNNNYVYYDLTCNTYLDNLWESEYNNTSNTANTITQGKKYNGSLYNGKDVDFYKFKSTTNAFKIKFDINLNEVSADAVQYGWKISVYPVDSASPLTSYEVSSVGSFESVTLPYQKGKEYFIKVEAKNYVYAPVYQPYHITVADATASKKWEVEKGGSSYSYATTAADATKYYGNLINGKDVDIYKYAVPAKGALKVSFARPDSADDAYGFKVTLKNAAGTVVKTATYNDVLSGSFSGVVYKGTYYVVVESANSVYAPSSEINYAIASSYTLGKPTLSAVKASGKKALKATWKKVSYVNGYQVQYSTYKTFASSKTKTKTVNKNSTTSYTVKSSYSKKTYYVRIRAYVKVGSKIYYSAWTSAKSAKTK